MPLKSKLILLFLAFTLVPLVLFGTIVFSQARNILQTVRTAQLDTIADLKKDKIETFFQEREADIRSAQDFRNIRMNLPVLSTHGGDRTSRAYGRAKKELDEQIKTFQLSYGYMDVMLLDPRGKVVYVSNNEHAAAQLGKPLQNRKFFEEGRKGIYFTDVFFGTEGNRRVEMIGIAPVHDLQGAFVGAVALEIDMAPIFKFIQDTTGLGTTGEALIARKEGNATVFLSPLQHDPNAALKRVVSLQEKIAVPAIKAAQGENGSGITYDYHGEEVLAAWRYIPFLRWGLVTKIDASEVFAPVRKLRVLVISVGIFIVLIGALAALAISRTVTGPILSLQKGAEAIAAGDLSHRVGTLAQDEVGRLSRAFDAMTDAIDQRVRERTIELENAVAERKEAERILELANAYNRSLLEASLDPLVTIDAGGKITDVNVATEKVTGRSRAELIGTDFSDYFTEPAKAKAGYQQVFDEGFVMDYALEIRRGDGHITPVLYNAAIYNDDAGNVIGVFAAARDITERKRAEDEIRKLNRELEARVIERTAQLEASNKELEAFAYSVSHDLRTPLRGIDGFSLALLEDYADKLDDIGKDYLERVRAGALKMGQLIDALLNLSRLTRGEIKRATVDLSILARNAADELKKSEPDRRVEFIIAGGVTVKGDPVMLRAVMDNLLANAWKFTGKRDAARIEFGVKKADGKTAYFVRDNGSGFDMTYANKLFTAFQRLHGTTDFPGLGIGLATVQRIIHRHGGRVWAEGEVERGATFYFTLS